MPRYEIKGFTRIWVTISVNATSEVQAKMKAYNIFENDYEITEVNERKETP